MANKRKTYLINPSFQIRFALYVSFAVFISSIVYPFAIYNLIVEVTTNIVPNNTNALTNLSNKKNELILFLAMWQAGFTALVFIICIFIGHKIAGPLFKLRKYFLAIKSGNSLGKLVFRKGDYFPELANDYNDAIELIQENYKKDFVYLSEVNTYLNNLSLIVPDDKKIVIQEISKKLAEIQDRFKSI